MERFLGRHPKRIDAKGRVSIPAPFRAVLVRDGFEGLFCVRALSQPAVEAGGHALIRQIDAVVDAHDPFSPEHLLLATTLMGAGDTLTIDGEGRIVVPDWIRTATGAADELVFVGLGQKFQIWAPEAFGRFEAEAREAAAALIARTRGGAA
ncbi:division/cell wall cluster transcriptional repressor MraZ [Prosthecomicrobium sp. N25]|uniref:division/cell wall cluster transcriptional repressor MraZ n=1 Tax=Prosthecomicrobium sp. N25 TaxID=3129254 RepID=UPI003078A483